MSIILSIDNWRRLFLNCAAFFLLCCLFTSCGEPTAEELIRKGESVSLQNYYPIHDNSSWVHEWRSTRGDKWRGSMTVVRKIEKGPDVTYIVIDSTEESGSLLISQSGYSWDQSGLTHLYKINSNGDSIHFNPPRVVVPGSMTAELPFRSDYRYAVYSPSNEVRYSGNVRLVHKLEKAEKVESNAGVWDDCVVVKTIRTDTDTDGKTYTRRKAVWLAKDVGPVKLISGIPETSKQLKGDLIGLLISTTNTSD